MPLGRYPERVKSFKEWSAKQVADAKLSGSVTPTGSRKRRRKKRKASKGRKRRSLQDG